MTTEQQESAAHSGHVSVVSHSAEQTESQGVTGTTTRRRRGGRRVVRATGAAGAKLPVHVQSDHQEQAHQEPSVQDVQAVQETQQEAQEAQTKQEVQSDKAVESNNATQPHQEQSKSQRTRGTSRKRSAQYTGATGTRTIDIARKARIDALAQEFFTDPGIEDEIEQKRSQALERVSHEHKVLARQADVQNQHQAQPQAQAQSSQSQSSQSQDSVVDTAQPQSAHVHRPQTAVAFSALPEEEHQALPPVRPMTSLLFQEPVLPAHTRNSYAQRNNEADDTADASTQHDTSRRNRQDKQDRQDRSDRQNKSRTRRNRRSQEEEQATQQATSHTHRHEVEQDNQDRTDHVRGNRDAVEQETTQATRKKSRNRRLNAQERRAAAEVEHIEEDLQYDDIDYTPIDELDNEEGADFSDFDLDAEEESTPMRTRRRRRRASHSRSNQDRDRQGQTSQRHDEDENASEHESASLDEEHDNARDERTAGRSAKRNRNANANTDDDDATTTLTRRRRRRRKTDETEEEPTIRRSRKQQYIDEITDIEGSTRLEAKKQRRRDNRRDRSRQSTLLEQDFLARREHVNRLMVVREKDQHTQISVIEDSILVEHYVSDIQEVSAVGNIYLGRVQNVLPSMEAAFVDIGQPRNGVLYAGEVNWDSTRLEGQPRRIELAYKSGDPVLVQVTKDPIGHKGARLTSQVTLAGRFLVLVPSGGMTGVSRKLPERERARLKSIIANIAPENMGIIIRTAAEGASAEAIEKDLQSLVRQWEKVQKNEEKARNSKRPKLLKGEPDVAIRVVRDIFNDDFNKLVVEGDTVYDRIQEYLETMAPDLQNKLERWDPAEHQGNDVFDQWRIDSQLRKGMERKVYLPSGGSLVIDRTEAMTTIDVNTGRFIGKGKSLEETVTRCNLEAAEEIARQLRLRDIGGMVMIDFVDMVMPANRDLVLRRLVECLARDRTKHQVAEVTSLGLVQMTRKRVGQGLVEAFSEECPTCKGRGFILHDEPTVSAKYDDPYALKGGDPFISTHKYVHNVESKPAKEDTAIPQASSQEVKDKLARIAAAAQAASEERRAQAHEAQDHEAQAHEVPNHEQEQHDSASSENEFQDNE
ncbi:ribonuclease G [Galliscardovia ingluviei]|uniref:Ribonuclease E n=1 Tax=Galliscardovia ingluviei TaxID=1769422 RepID=A0A8J3EYX9_9BIFI|nr:ribonuclease G [Galliscardovia ingluviei]